MRHPNLPDTYEIWRNLEESERLRIFDQLTLEDSTHPILVGLAKEFTHWGKQTAGVVETILGYNQGSRELRVVWDKEVLLTQTPSTFIGIPVRNVHIFTDAELRSIEAKARATPEYFLFNVLPRLIFVPLGWLAKLFSK